MAIWGVIADDLTGANTAAALLTTSSFRTLTTIDHHNVDQFPLKEYDAIVVNTASRTLDAKEAYERTKTSTEELWNLGIRHFSKRIDSTIRGNLGAETEGMLAALSDDTVACVVAAFPASNRIVVGGYQIVKGVPVHKTLAGSDPIKPVLSSIVVDEFKRQTNLPITSIPLEFVAKGGTALQNEVEKQILTGSRILIFDAISSVDIASITEAMQAVDRPWIAVDPGPLTQNACELVAKNKPRLIKKEKKGKILIIAGSASDLTNTQVKYLRNQTDAKIVTIDIRPFINSETPHPNEAIIAKRIRMLSQISDVIGLKASGYTDMLIDVNLEAEKRNVTADEITGRITHALARIVNLVLNAEDAPDFKGLYLTGGDMTVAFCQECQVRALELYGEIQPHISFGRLVGGFADGMPIVTKGGMIGETDTILTCIDYMLTH